MVNMLAAAEIMGRENLKQPVIDWIDFLYICAQVIFPCNKRVHICFTIDNFVTFSIVWSNFEII
jgi:hypothetical protein